MTERETVYQVLHNLGHSQEARSLTSRFAWTVGEKIHHLHWCERCHAGPGAPCVTKTGRVASFAHQSRQEKTRELLAAAAHKMTP